MTSNTRNNKLVINKELIQILKVQTTFTLHCLTVNNFGTWHHTHSNMPHVPVLTSAVYKVYNMLQQTTILEKINFVILHIIL